MDYLRSSFSSLPEKPGVYQFLDRNADVLYVGKANSLRSRVSSYFQKGAVLGEKTRLLVSQVEKIRVTTVESEVESLLLESHFIKKFTPKYNIRLTDDKSYPLIRITIKDKSPAVLFARRTDDKASLYFGPFPNPGAVKLVLRIIRRVFPFQSALNHPKRICLYHHLGLCPCPPLFQTESKRKEYKNHLKNIIRILEGESHTLLKELQKERKSAVKTEAFEKAQEIQRQIQALSIITEPRRLPFEYEVNPNLRTDIRKQEMDELASVLRAHGLRVTNLNKIECYDISNIQGTSATGSLVVLQNGEVDKSQYRKFKIRKDGTPNDFAMMEEVLQRRMKHTEWEYPDLLIVDGGKGQLTAAHMAFATLNVAVPLIGLAKREETIIIPKHQIYFESNQTGHSGEKRSEAIESLDKKKILSSFGLQDDKNMKLYGSNEDNFIEVSLPKDSPALHLLQRIRNEAHRFAITYHKKLRSKAFLMS